MPTYNSKRDPTATDGFHGKEDTIAYEVEASETHIALVIDLDGTLVRSDLFYESIFDAVARNGWRVFNAGLFRNLSRQALKIHLADLSEICYRELPFNETVLALIVAAKDKGRKVYLATAGSRRHAEGVAGQLNLFDGIFASDKAVNLKGERKADALLAAFGDRGFDYVGNAAEDFAVWKHARRALSVGLSARSSARLDRVHENHTRIGAGTLDHMSVLKALRPHQYAKNGLIFVPLLTSHEFTLGAFLSALLAFIAFSLCASGVYLLNDLLDIQSDRGHPTKRMRPFAAGMLPLSWGMVLVPILTLAAFAVSSLLPPLFMLLLAIYLAVTNAYSLVLKKRMIVDVVTLSMLYTIRIVAGAAAIEVDLSEWLFTFSLMMFTSLALTKRHIELATRLDKGLPDPSNRDYKVTDLPVIAGLAAAAGMNSITVLALYVSSPELATIYSRPHILWGLCPLFLFWIGRAVMLAHRRLMDDDPIAFALRDSRSWTVGVAAVLLILVAW